MSNRKRILLILQIALVVFTLTRNIGILDRITGNVIQDEICSFVNQQIVRLDQMKSKGVILNEEQYRAIEDELSEFRTRVYFKTDEEVELWMLMKSAYNYFYFLEDYSKDDEEFIEYNQKIAQALDGVKELLRKYSNYED